MNKILIALILSACCLTVEAAPTRYSYTGNLFNFFEEGVPGGADRITGFLEFDEPLGPNFNDVLNPTGFEFGDGVSTISETTTLRESFLHAVTDDTGEITAWNVIFTLPAFNEGDHAIITTFNNLDVIPSIHDGSTYCAVDNGSGDCGGFESEFPGVSAIRRFVPGSWTITVVARFNDVPANYWAFSFIETLADSGITSGCSEGNYCPEDSVTRAQMAIFLERGMNGSGFSPPAAKGNVFLDVSVDTFAASFIEQLFLDGITSGCGSNNYCPTAEVTRAQMAVFLLKAKYGSGYFPPPATGIFDDVLLSHWAVAWIEQLAVEGITSGCSEGHYCPEDTVTRAQMAVFLVRAFDL